MIHIPLTRGLFAIVDDEDAHLAEHRWSALRTRSDKVYVCRTARTGGKRVLEYLHRVVLGVTDRHVEVDHINGDTLDNRRTNLRAATHRENARNQRKKTTNRSGYKGVCYVSRLRSKPWMASIVGLDGKSKHLGYFGDAVEAALAYDAAARQQHGEFAKLNFPAAQSGSPSPACS